MDLSSFGNDSSKKTQYLSELKPQKLYSNADEFNLKYKKLSDLYLSDYEHLTTTHTNLRLRNDYFHQKQIRKNFKCNNNLINFNHVIWFIQEYKLMNKFSQYYHIALTNEGLNLSDLTLKQHALVPNMNLTETNYSIKSKINQLLQFLRSKEQYIILNKAC
jgi:hypothetical protein